MWELIKMKREEWEAFWKWLNWQGFDVDYDYDPHYWLHNRMQEWKKFDGCLVCGVKGKHRVSEKHGEYILSQYDLCEGCKNISNNTNLVDKAVVIRDIEAGSMSPNRIRYLIEDFDLKEDDLTLPWAKEVVKEFHVEVAEAKEFARVSKAERDALEKEVKNRLERVVERDDKNE